MSSVVAASDAGVLRSVTLEVAFSPQIHLVNKRKFDLHKGRPTDLFADKSYTSASIVNSILRSNIETSVVLVGSTLESPSALGYIVKKVLCHNLGSVGACAWFGYCRLAGLRRNEGSLGI